MKISLETKTRKCDKAKQEKKTLPTLCWRKVEKERGETKNC